MTFGERLKELRKAQKMTQRQLAERLGVAKSVVSYYESGERFPSVDVLMRTSELFHRSTDYLLGFECNNMIDVSELTDEEVAIVTSVIDGFKNKK